MLNDRYIGINELFLFKIVYHSDKKTEDRSFRVMYIADPARNPGCKKVKPNTHQGFKQRLRP